MRKNRGIKDINKTENGKLTYKPTVLIEQMPGFLKTFYIFRSGNEYYIFGYLLGVSVLKLFKSIPLENGKISKEKKYSN